MIAKTSSTRFRAKQNELEYELNAREEYIPVLVQFNQTLAGYMKTIKNPAAH